jgi:DNA polymerase I
MILECFQQIWCVDYEYSQPDGDRPTPICCVAHEVRSGQTIRLWQDELRRPEPPYPIGQNSLFVAYLASAELSCHLALGWPFPTHIIDLYVEYSQITNGLERPYGRKLLGAMLHGGIVGIDNSEKVAMQQLAQRGGPWTAAEREDLLGVLPQ